MPPLRSLSVASIAAVLSLGLTAPDVQARSRPAFQTLDDRSANDGDYPVRHVSDVINRHPTAVAARSAFAATHISVRPVPAKTGHSHVVGDTRAFKVYNVAAASGGGKTLHFDSIEFTLMAEGTRFRIWVESEELRNGHIRTQDVDDFRQALADRTPKASRAPNSGIFSNNEALFGRPPDVDGDGVTDVLLVDIRDNASAETGYVAGFVWHGDLDPKSEIGNGRDVLYIDTYPGIYRDGAPRSTRRAEATAAHELQHLIHLAYDTEEATFVNEGLSEWAEMANGYSDHAVAYLNRPGTHSTGLLDWHDYDPSLQSDDYERAGLFTAYLASRLGEEPIREIARARRGGAPLSGADGYREVLKTHGLSLEDVVVDFHMANLVNDAGVDPAYSYEGDLPQRLPVVSAHRYNGKDLQSTKIQDVRLRPGGVMYATWRGVADLQVVADANQKADLRIRAFLKRADGSNDILDLSPDGMVHKMRGEYREIKLALISANPDGAVISALFEAIWSETTSGVRFESVSYDDGEAEAFFRLSAGGSAGQATRFILPEGGAEIESISIAPYFANQFDGTYLPTDAERDLEVRVWNANRDGAPDSLLLTLPVTDPRPYAPASHELNFFDVDLAPYTEELPGTIYIGIVDAGDDANHLVAAVSSYEESISYTGNAVTGDWKPLWDVQLLGSADPFPMRKTVVPIRAEFMVAGAPADRSHKEEIPSTITLDQNYPNPFNPSSVIQYHLPEAGKVRLAVYDMVGRQIATLVDGLRDAGSHEVNVDAAAWASGVYVYTLEAAGSRAVRKMVVAR